MDRLRGRPVLVEFWDFCRPNSLRTLPYLSGWHDRYSGEEGDGPRGEGLQVLGVHSPGFEPSRERKAVKDAVERLGIAYPVLIDSDLEMWRVYENEGWPARYLFDKDGMLYDYHYGEGAYDETELAIQQLLGVKRKPLAPIRPEDAPGASLVPQTEDQPGAYCGPYEAGGVWAVLEGSGMLRINGGEAREGSDLSVTQPGAYPLIEHERHTQAVLDLELEGELRCLQTCFLPGVP